MKEDWTPGPWFLDQERPRYAVNQQGTNRHIAMVSCYEAVANDADENAANAHLIAAAPELYAALERLYGRLLMSDRDGECRITAEEGEMAEFALKKARGEL